MAGRTYDRLCIEDFGKHLIQTGDLDPIYLALHELSLPVEQKHRWLLAYWCFYHAGFASWLSEKEGLDYWDGFLTAAINHPEHPAPSGRGDVNGGWPRGKERRHFRGQQAIKATQELMAKFQNPCDAVPSLLPTDNSRFTWYKDLKKRVLAWRGFGDWISYKVGDMLDRCGVFPVIFEFEDAMYKDPTQAALLLWKVKNGAPENAHIDDEPAAVLETVSYLQGHFKDFTAPPIHERPIGLQEIETILCKWKSHLGGHYPLFNDIDEIAHGVAPWAKTCVTAQRFAAAMPKRSTTPQ